MVSKLDDSVGQIVGALTETGMIRNSVIVFVSDNGAPSIGTHQNWGSNYPLRGVRVIYIQHRSDQGILIATWLLKRDKMIYGEFCLQEYDSCVCRKLKINLSFRRKCNIHLEGIPSKKLAKIR
jgi:hypothetical protein